jgi:tetratricopeptide (TPR) repeat protein
MNGRVLGFAMLLAWGVLKTPLETRLTREMQNARLGGFVPTANLRQQTGQAGFIAALGGLRAAIADLLWIRAHIAWQGVQYGRMKLLFDTCTAMQPRRVQFWDSASWHMAWNGAAHVRNNVQNETERAVKMKEFFKIGEDYILRGIQSNPDSWELYDRLGLIYRDKFKDHEKAAKAYDEASKRPHHLDYTRRFAAYELAQVPGREREAYDRLLGLYREGEQQWLDTLLKRLQVMERKLQIPAEQRVPIPPQYRLPPE